MRRSAPLRRTPLRRGTSQLKRSRLNPVGKKAKREASDLARFRLAVAMRSGGWCEVNTPSCAPGRHEGTQAHHRLMRSQGGTHDVENGLWVCSPGHLYVHANPAESYERGWLVKSWEASA